MVLVLAANKADLYDSIYTGLYFIDVGMLIYMVLVLAANKADLYNSIDTGMYFI